MALTFSDMQLEVLARFRGNVGLYNPIRVRRWLNDAMHQVDEMEKWDYTYTSATGAAPLTIADLRDVESVSIGGAPLPQADRRKLGTVFGDLSTAGTALYWYRSAPTQVTLYPAGTSAITVRYWKFGPDLVAGTDTPLMPDRFRPVIVEMACAKGFRDASATNQANDALQEASRIVDAMLETQLPRLLRRPAKEAK